MEVGLLEERIPDDERIKYLEKAIKLKNDVNFDGNITPCFLLFGIGWIKYNKVIIWKQLNTINC